MRDTDLIIRLRLPRWSLRRWLLVASVAVVGASAVAVALPNNYFVAGNALTAADLNMLVAAINKPVITRNGKQYSLGATYCGATTTTTDGQMGGYTGAKALCEALPACGTSPTAHMCTSEELTRSMQLDMTTAGGWYSGGIVALPLSNPDIATNDCGGWKSSGSIMNGPVWQGSPANAPSFAGCYLTFPVLCCD
jgi:hypothetical protein